MSELTPVTREEMYLGEIANALENGGGGGGGGGFTPTTAQLAAMNSGITAEKLQTDENNILNIINTGAKNTIKLNELTDSTYWGFAVDTQTDGKLKITGTPSLSSSEVTFYISGDAVAVADSSARIIGKLPPKLAFMPLPQGSEVSRIIINLYNGDTWVHAFNNLTTIHDISDKVYDRYSVGIGIKNGVTYNETLPVMICSEAAWQTSQDYEPYCPTLAELYALVKSYHSGT